MTRATTPRKTANQRVANRARRVAAFAAPIGMDSADRRSIMIPSVAPRPPGSMARIPAILEKAKINIEFNTET